MLDLNDLYYFAHVVDHQGFTAAGKALKVPKSNLSRRVLKLEQALGVRLIQRSSRRFVVTELGAEFYQHCRAMMIEAEEAENAVRRRRAEPVGRVRFNGPRPVRCGGALASVHARPSQGPDHRTPEQRCR
jgi:DNA-binding transcriptional LysR family regulator